MGRGIGRWLACGLATTQSGQAATVLSIDGSGNPYIENGFEIDPITIVNGNCDGVSGKPCLALNSNDVSTLTKVGGGTFSLDSFGFEFQGQPSELTLTAYVGATLVATLVYGDPTYPDKNVWYVVSPAISGITSVTFADTGTGNLRIDDINVTVASAVPLPAAAPLFATGLGAIGLLGWRRKRKAAISQG